MPHGPYAGESIFNPMPLHPAPPGMPTMPNGSVDICALITPQTTTSQRTSAGRLAQRISNWAGHSLPDLFDMCTKALLKLLFSTLCASMEQARYLFQRLNQWDAPLFDFNDLWSIASFTDSDFKAEHSLAKVKDFVGVPLGCVSSKLLQ